MLIIRRTVTGTLLVFLLLCVFADWYTSRPILEACHGYKHEEQGRTDHNQSNQCATLRSIYFDGRPVALRAIDTAIDYPEAITGIATLLLAVITGWLVFVARDQTKTSRAQLRAYVLPESASLVDGTTVNPPQTQFAGVPASTLIFKNSGVTPAFQYVSWAEIAVIEFTKANTLTVPPLQMVFPGTIGANGGSVPKYVRFRRALTQAEISDIASGVKAIFVYGRIEYWDAFKHPRWSNFRLYYQGVYPPPMGVSLYFSEGGGNEAN